MRFLIFGDVFGRLGRDAINQILPQLREEHQPDSVIINIENIAHGKGISPDTVTEALKWQADVYTTGDHAWDNTVGLDSLNDKKIPIIRPANYPDGVPGRGYHIFTNGAWQVAVINLQGQVFFRNHPLNPFHYLDQLLEQPDIKKANIVLVDFHAEVTSESRGLGWHADGRVSAIWGTHTHVPTADAQIMPQGTGYITDVGMVGGYNSIIGTAKEAPLRMFLKQTRQSMEQPDDGPLEVNALLLDVDPKSGQTTDIALIRQILNDSK